MFYLFLALLAEIKDHIASFRCPHYYTFAFFLSTSVYKGCSIVIFMDTQFSL